MMSLKEFRKQRNRAGILLGLVYDAMKQGRGEEAKKIYNMWRQGKITYRQALARLKKLVNNTR